MYLLPALLLVGCVTDPEKDTLRARDAALPDECQGVWLLAYADADGDGFGDPQQGVLVCDGAPDHVLDLTDCDDASEDVHPRAVETCDGRDQDCDGEVDEEAVDPVTWYRDEDDDSFGVEEQSVLACDAPEGYAERAGDCDDADAAISPAALERCDEPGVDEAGAEQDAVDEDCDGAANDADPDDAPDSAWYPDVDQDGFGDDARRVYVCDAPEAYVSVGGDCDDTSSARSPSAQEVCDDAALDEDCDGIVEDADPSVDEASLGTWYADADADGYGGAAIVACRAPAGAVAVAGDCDDLNGWVSPGAVERCDSADVDEDCDGAADEAGASGESRWSLDVDGDGFGTVDEQVDGCDAPSGYVASAYDCDDEDDTMHPGAAETCGDALDTDCDGTGDACEDTVATSLTTARVRVATEAGHAGGFSLDVGDLDGDGRADLFLSSTSETSGAERRYGTIYTVLGAPPDGLTVAGTDGAAQIRATPTDPGHTGGIAGDLDGDGSLDLLVGGYGGVGVLHGPFAGDGMMASVGVTSVPGDYVLARPAAGDVDEDGIDDALLRVGSASSADAGLVLFGDEGRVYAEARLVGEATGDEAGAALAGGEDVDGDGLVDVLVGATGARGGLGAAYVVAGPILGDRALADEVAIEGAGDDFGAGLEAVGDLDDDGYGDIAVLAPGATEGTVSVFRGPLDADRVAADADRIIADVPGAGAVLLGAGDLDDDGFDDFVVGAPSDSTTGAEDGAAYVFYGPAAGASTVTDAQVRAFGHAGGHAGAALAAGDNDGDGVPELFVAADEYALPIEGLMGVVYVVPGGSR
ncbi:MAG: MopE-related protein [Pseudomonadota bacterium]|nr:MopE-related protein [Pseudomonadota bacterium]